MKSIFGASHLILRTKHRGCKMKILSTNYQLLTLIVFTLKPTVPLIFEQHKVAKKFCFYKTRAGDKHFLKLLSWKTSKLKKRKTKMRNVFDMEKNQSWYRSTSVKSVYRAVLNWNWADVNEYEVFSNVPSWHQHHKLFTAIDRFIELSKIIGC